MGITLPELWPDHSYARLHPSYRLGQLTHISLTASHSRFDSTEISVCLNLNCNNKNCTSHASSVIMHKLHDNCSQVWYRINKYIPSVHLGTHSFANENGVMT